MLFKFNKTLSEEDYFAFNVFQSLESEYGKNWIRRRRIFFITYVVFATALVVCINGWRTYSIYFTIFTALVTILYMLLLKKMVVRNLKMQMKQLKKTSKLPFDRASTMEFYEDKFVDITASTRTEESYNAIERICIVKDQYVFLYYSSTGAYVLPIVQIKAQISYEEFVNFLSGKCANVHTFPLNKKA